MTYILLTLTACCNLRKFISSSTMIIICNVRSRMYIARCECDSPQLVVHSRLLKEGQIYSGRAFNETAKS